MAMGRFGGMNIWFARIGIGALLGFVTSLLAGFLPSITGFLPGILGQLLGWAILGWIVTILVGIMLSAFGARKRGQ